METLVFVLVAHFARYPDVQVRVFDPRACVIGTPAECMIGAYDDCRREEAAHNLHDAEAQAEPASCELMDRAKAHPLPVVP